jgi:hypothetical protein
MYLLQVLPACITLPQYPVPGYGTRTLVHTFVGFCECEIRSLKLVEVRMSVLVLCVCVS